MSKEKKEENKKYKFKIGEAKKPSEKRILKVKGKSLKSFNVLFAYIAFLTRFMGLKTFSIFIFNVLQKFFFIQYFQKFHILHIPCKNVDHELDEKVPFCPEKINCYLDFVNYWIRPLCLILKRYGITQGIKLACEFVCYITKAYKDAYKIYTHSLTTTRRPSSSNKTVQFIQFWDPHFLCVPSLHISIVLLMIGFYRMLFEREGFSESEKEMWNSEIFLHGIEIAESVLFMKQHSINCLSAALYMMTKTSPEIVDEKIAKEFIASLFSTSNEVDEDEVLKIRSYIQTMYFDLIKESEKEKDWTVPLKKWIDNYKPYMPS